MKYFVSIVSHGHLDFINQNLALFEIVKMANVTVVVKDNIQEPALLELCRSKGFFYLTSQNRMGFGENNNFVYHYCRDKLSMADDDYFLTINPDVIISTNMFFRLMEAAASRPQLFTINLFKDANFEVPELSLREFPKWSSLINLFLNVPVCKAYGKTLLPDNAEVNWASGAFLGFKSFLYGNLGGFDPRYFMYYEDVDICYRAKRDFNVGVVFFKGVKAVHVGAYQNRNILSKHFCWYIASLCKFLIRKSFFGK